MCGLLAAQFLNWQIVGYYDGKVLVIKDGLNYEDCVFLDMEINRDQICSIGNHLIEYDNHEPARRHFNNCIQPNIFRGFDGKHAFQRKYPFGTIHLQLGILQAAGVIDRLPKAAISPLLFVDGVGNNLFGYPENCLDWIDYLAINQPDHILYDFLCANKINFYEIMQHLTKFFATRDTYNATGYYDEDSFILGGRNLRTGHKIRLSDTKGNYINLAKHGELYDLHSVEATRVQGFIKEIADMMEWDDKPEQWTWQDLQMIKFNKGLLSSESSSAPNRLNLHNYLASLIKNRFHWL